MFLASSNFSSNCFRSSERNLLIATSCFRNIEITELWIKSKDPVNLVNGIGKRFVKALGLDKEGGRPAEEGSFSLEFQVSPISSSSIDFILKSPTGSSIRRSKEGWRRVESIDDERTLTLSFSRSLRLQYNQGSAPPISKYITLSSSTSASLARPGVKGAWRTNSSSAVPSLVVVGEGVGA